MHYKNLDVLRGIAILLVLLHHYNNAFFSKVNIPFLSNLFKFSWSGVDLFFVLSGFLITKSLLRLNFNLKHFYISRALRILPLSIIYLLVLLALDQSKILNIGLSTKVLLSFIFFLGNFNFVLNGWMHPTISILWSLSIEEQFYSVFPLMAKKSSNTKLLKILLLVVFTAPLIRLIIYKSLGMVAVYTFTLGRLDVLSLGCILGLIHSKDAFKNFRANDFYRITKWIVLCCGLILLLIPFEINSNSSLASATVYFSIVALFYSVILVESFFMNFKIPIINNILIYLGKRSFGLYLLHYLSIKLSIIYVPNNSLYASIILLFLFTEVSWVFLEKKMIALKPYFIQKA